MTTKTLFSAVRHVGHPIAELAHLLERRIQEHAHRNRLKDLRDLDDAMLKDIGVTRGDIDAATSLPLSADASEALRHLSLERRRLNM